MEPGLIFAQVMGRQFRRCPGCPGLVVLVLANRSDSRVGRRPVDEHDVGLGGPVPGDDGALRVVGVGQVHVGACLAGAVDEVLSAYATIFDL